MAIHADTDWEIRSTGNDDNGAGFYDRDPGTSVDYSQQDSAELTLTDLATDGAGTGLSSVTGGFTAAMAGNIIYIKSGTGFSVGYYEITAYTDTNNVTIDRSAGISATAGTGSVGGGRATITDAFGEMLVDGNDVYLKSGTYTQTAHFNIANDGSDLSPIQLIGYQTTHDDYPTGDDRPLVAAGAWIFAVDQKWHVKNIRLTTTDTSGLKIGSGSAIINCKSYNSSGTAGRYALYASSTQSRILNSDAQSDNGTAIISFSSYFAYGNYAHDSTTGIYLPSSGHANMNVVDTCTTGIQVAGTISCFAVNNTLYNCTKGIYISSSASAKHTFLNNDFESNTTGLDKNSTDRKTNIADFNNYNGNGTDINNVTQGVNASTDDPSFTDAGNGDFTNSLPSDAAPEDFGGTTTNAMNRGAVQSAGAGGGETSYVTIS
jgi:parallel beta-helix repeat protein